MTDTFSCIASRAARYPVVTRRSQMSKTAMFSSKIYAPKSRPEMPRALSRDAIAAIISV